MSGKHQETDYFLKKKYKINEVAITEFLSQPRVTFQLLSQKAFGSWG